MRNCLEGNKYKNSNSNVKKLKCNENNVLKINQIKELDKCKEQKSLINKIITNI